jgi:hypothetical protein
VTEYAQPVGQEDTKPVPLEHTESASHENTKTRRLFWLVRGLAISCLCLGAPRAALACPVCFGDSDAPMANAMNMGILFMLIIVGGVLVAFASFFIHLIRRAKLADNGLRPAESGRFGEDTAQC